MIGTCKLIDSGQIDEKTSYFIFEKLGTSLFEKVYKNSTFSIETVACIGKKMVFFNSF
jgi:hypothetical protein